MRLLLLSLKAKKIGALALEVAQKAIVLLKNNGVLPLQKDKIKSIAVIGPKRLARLKIAPPTIVETIFEPSAEWTLFTKLSAFIAGASHSQGEHERDEENSQRVVPIKKLKAIILDTLESIGP